MKKIDILSRLKNAGVIAVVRGKSKEEALNACHAIIKGGLTGIELTFTVPQADQSNQRTFVILQRSTRNSDWRRYGIRRCHSSLGYLSWRRVYC